MNFCFSTLHFSEFEKVTELVGEMKYAFDLMLKRFYIVRCTGFAIILA